MYHFVNVILKDALVYVRHFKRHTLMVNDIKWAAKRLGKTIYGIE